MISIPTPGTMNYWEYRRRMELLTTSLRNEGFVPIPLGRTLSETVERIQERIQEPQEAHSRSLEIWREIFAGTNEEEETPDEKSEKSPGKLSFKPEEKSDDNYEALIADMDKLLEEE